MATEQPSRRHRRWLRWVIRFGLALRFPVCIAVTLGWFHLQRTAAEGKKQLASAIAETDILDPRWRWEEIQEDLPAIPDAENSMRVINQVADSLKGWNPSTLALPEGEYVLVLEDRPANRQLDDERLALIRNALEN